MNNVNAWQAHSEAVRGLSFSPNDSRFVTASDDSTLKLWAFEESREERVLTGESSLVIISIWLLTLLQAMAGMFDASSGTLQRVFSCQALRII